ncbi:MAG: hypothetical protein IT503_01685 [Burkholderiaceae bacterium]|nr:MAG: hypothetical protein F9K36_10325 [Burkholderiaceae bacterium]MBE7425534.1 hypothetical protein [Ideonella sp.]MCC7284868.1 hypothetical protein [Burkholderiaceae bacterium]
MRQRKRLKLICSLCEGSGWLCDEHPDLPWSHDDDCEGGGIACRCNELARLPLREVFVDFDALDAGVR